MEKEIAETDDALVQLRAKEKTLEESIRKVKLGGTLLNQRLLLHYLSCSIDHCIDCVQVPALVALI
jgi:hypothetical protein